GLPRGIAAPTASNPLPFWPACVFCLSPGPGGVVLSGTGSVEQLSPGRNGCGCCAISPGGVHPLAESSAGGTGTSTRGILGGSGAFRAGSDRQMGRQRRLPRPDPGGSQRRGTGTVRERIAYGAVFIAAIATRSRN